LINIYQWVNRLDLSPSTGTEIAENPDSACRHWLQISLKFKFKKNNELEQVTNVFNTIGNPKRRLKHWNYKLCLI
jgi:hypothetical protein